jgi:hypothetical protein
MLCGVSTRMGFGGGELPSGYKWSNRWFVEADSVTLAAEFGRDMWIAILQAMHNDACFCYEVYAEDLNPATSLYDVLAVDPGDQRGTLGGIAGHSDYYNPSIAARFNLNVSGGRPSRKFIRPGIQEQWVGDGGTVITNSGVLSAWATGSAALASLVGLVDESGNAFSSVAFDGLTTRKLGKTARNDLPSFPAFG